MPVEFMYELKSTALSERVRAVDISFSRSCSKYVLRKRAKLKDVAFQEKTNHMAKIRNQLPINTPTGKKVFFPCVNSVGRE